MQQQSIRVQVPAQLGAVLLADGIATIGPDRRSSTWQLLASWAGGGATVVSLLQTPQVVSDLAERCCAFATKFRHSSSVPSGRMHLEAVGPKGQLRISLDADTSILEIEQLLRRTIFCDGTGDSADT